MKNTKLALIDEQTSPLLRIIVAQNFNDPYRRQFDNNICAFHIGNGYILSVAHNLRIEGNLLKVISEQVYRENIHPHLNPAQAQLFNKVYQPDPASGKRFMNITDPADVPKVKELFRQINFDTRWITLVEKNFYKPYLAIHFRDGNFYNDPGLNRHFQPAHFFHEPGLKRFTFLLELEMVSAFYSEDIAIYKIINTPTEIIRKLPAIEPDYRMLDDTEKNFYCLQSAPGVSLGRLLNNARIEGLLDTWNTFNDRVGGNYILEGSRYLIKGYFRFGSSGAPYIVYDEKDKIFRVNAIQSEASPVQLTLNNSMEGNFQWINAIGTPLLLIKDELVKLV